MSTIISLLKNFELFGRLIMILNHIAAVLTGYFLGSINFAVLLSRGIRRKDVRSCGSGNAGATNMARTFGLGCGLETMAGDMAKTAVAILIARVLIGGAGIASGGLSCLMGHCFPVFYNFKGGKGVAVGSVIILFASPAVFAAVITVFLAAAFLTKKVSLASLTAAASGAFMTVLFPVSLFSKAAVFLAAAVIFICHRQNIKRLIKGTEPDFVLPAKKRA